MNGAPAIGIVGAGAFGTALAVVAASRAAGPVHLYGRNAETTGDIAERRENRAHLPGIALPEAVSPTNALQDLSKSDIVLLCVPSQGQRAAARALVSVLRPQAAVVICAKGLEQSSAFRLSDVVAGELGARHPIAALSGPGFAADIARGLPTAMTLAAADLAQAERIAAVLSCPSFRLYASDDLIGVQTGGALKNVLAIACGIVDGARLGESARAALIARGLAELTRFAVAEGARATTLSGLSGLGDLVLTATSRQSRNLRFGIALGEGKQAGDLLLPGAELAEGAYTAGVAARLARQRAIAMPITDAISQIIDGHLTVPEALTALMERPLTTEGH